MITSKHILKILCETTPADSSELSKLLGNNYYSFVSKLKSGISDVKTQAAILTGLQDGQTQDDIVNVSRTSVSVKSLIPTQNEVDMTKSLFYPLTDSSTAIKCLSGSRVVIQTPIITFREKYIIDGHHRWSQVYCVNSDATMAANNLTLGTTDPLKVLKAVQMSIAAQIKTVPVQTVEGTNLFGVSKTTFIKYVISTIKPEISEMFVSYRKVSDVDQIPEYIWQNVLKMRNTSRPISGAQNRGVMPQTDDAPGWEKPLELGKINWNTPL